MTKRSIIIDTDPGIDDAVALAMAIKNPELDIRLITTVAGNVDVEKTTDNALKIVEFLEADIPVAKGMAAPLLKQSVYAKDVHGETGMDGYDFPTVKRNIVALHAVEAMRKEIMKSCEKITLMPIAALTNIAVMLRMYPEVKKNIEEIVMMGGTLGKGNTNTVSEFNIFVDPHAAKIVLESGIKITMVPLDVTREAVIHKNSVGKLKQCGKLGEMFYGLFSHYRGGSIEAGLRIHDACAVAYLLKPEFFKVKEIYIDVVCEGAAAGALIADDFMKIYKDKEPNVNFCYEINTELFEQWFVETLSN